MSPHPSVIVRYHGKRAMDEDLADRIRRQLGDDPNIGEVRMFGGLCFTLNGNMLVCASRDGGMLARIGHAEMSAALERRGVTVMRMASRDSNAFVRIAEEALRTEPELAEWIALATRFVGLMPAKTKG